MTNDEIKDALETAIDNNLKLVKVLFPNLLGHGLDRLSVDQRIFGQASKTMEERLREKNRDEEYYIDEEDRVTGNYSLQEYKRRFRKE